MVALSSDLSKYLKAGSLWWGSEVGAQQSEGSATNPDTSHGSPKHSRWFVT
jgi:hypothetical protein